MTKKQTLLVCFLPTVNMFDLELNHLYLAAQSNVYGFIHLVKQLYLC